MRELSLFDKTILILNLFFGLILLLSCLSPFISVKTFIPLSFLGLFFPITFVLNLPFIFYWLFRKKKIFLLSLTAVLISYMAIGSFYKFGSTDLSTEDKDLSILTFNTRDFNFRGRAKSDLTGNEIINFIIDQDPDIVCFQEFGRIVQLEHYPYKYQTDFPSYKSSQAIFSKYPIVGTGSLEFPNTANNALYADILYKADTIRVYNIHFQSYKVIPSRLKRIRRGLKVYGKMRNAFIKQEEQVQIFVKHKKDSPYRAIVCGDFNNTSFSNMYRIAKGEMQDTFDEKGSGFGKTFDLKFIPFRIDFILVDKSMQVMTHQNFDLRLSDHYPIMTSIRL